MSAAIAILVQAILLAVGVLLFVAFVIGLAVAARPQWLGRLGTTSDRRVSMRRMTRSLDIPRNVDRWFYHHHRWYGLAVVVLSIGLLGFLMFGHEARTWTALFDRQYREVGTILVDTARVVLWGLALFSLCIGLLVWIRPSALRGFEHAANRWVTARRATRGLEHQVRGPEEWARAHPRAWGIAIAIAAAICLLALGLHAGSIMRLAG